MKLPNWLTFGLALLFTLIKLFVVTYQQNESLQAIYGGYGNLTLEEVYWLFYIRQEFLEQFLIITSLTGFLIRRNTGFILANIFPFFILGYGFFHLFDSTNIFAGYHIGQITFALLVIILTNTPSASNLFGLTFKSAMHLRMNLKSFSIAFLLILLLLGWISMNG